jgi:hypothetical protein
LGFALALLWNELGAGLARLAFGLPVVSLFLLVSLAFFLLVLLCLFLRLGNPCLGHRGPGRWLR